MNATLKKCCYLSCPPAGFSYSPCDTLFKITFTWEGPCTNLDTAVVYDGASSGYSCDNVGNPKHIADDDPQEGGSETHWVKIPPFENGRKYIYLYMHWHSENFTSSNCPVSISITNCDNLDEFTYCTVEDSTYNLCSSDKIEHQVGRIEVRTDSTFHVTQNNLTAVEGFCLPKSFDIQISGPVSESSTFTRVLDGQNTQAFWYGSDEWTGETRQLTTDFNGASFPFLNYIDGQDYVTFAGPRTIIPTANPLWYRLNTSVLRQPLTISISFEGSVSFPEGTYTYTFTPNF